ncbi:MULTISPECIES: TfoX/Sxy family protein [unclassified Parafrankia]|uniref:TfoX/Sxy family protein n=1 Tax=unclassified Parafrankia TaxID=2994368 RepID=UPI000DA4A40D|nr:MULTISPECIES: TfoX/Sxy family protein [unclassified Parafrankia]TCJ32237.1 TfoX family protein [Parafrankia sp. BMG5.11]SQE00236.1 Regulator of competence-specific genes [Parafrankia sp. Ea1.12]
MVEFWHPTGADRPGHAVSGHLELARHVLDQVESLGGMTLRRFFGGWALCHAGRQVALVMDTLYLKVADGERSAWETAGGRPFVYRAAGRDVTVRAYYSVPEETLDDRDALTDLVRHAISRLQVQG